MLAFVGFVAICLCIWWLSFRTNPSSHERWMKVAFIVCLALAALAVLEQTIRTGSSPL